MQPARGMREGLPQFRDPAGGGKLGWCRSAGRSDAIMMARSGGGVSKGREDRGGQIASLMKRNDGNANNTATDDGDHGRGDAAPLGDL